MWFGCQIDKEDIALNCFEGSSSLLKNDRNKTIECLDKYCEQSGIISGDKIIRDNFPVIDADVFISHSHDDEQYAHRVASFFLSIGLQPFLDSYVWKSADSLLKKIDNKYCFNKDKETYNYKARNLSTSYVHMMLASAICKMIDQCPLFLFIKSNNSTIVDIDRIQNCNTISPWIFFELLYFHRTQRHTPSKYKNFTKKDALEDSSERLKIKLLAETNDLIPISKSILQKMYQSYTKNHYKREDTLFGLYQMIHLI